MYADLASTNKNALEGKYIHVLGLELFENDTDVICRRFREVGQISLWETPTCFSVSIILICILCPPLALDVS